MLQLRKTTAWLTFAAWGAAFAAFCFGGYHSSDNDPLQFEAAIISLITATIALGVSLLHALVVVCSTTSRQLNMPQFSLRTLLIATTLIAVLLGLVVWAIS